jgi:hypothetical protein
MVTFYINNIPMYTGTVNKLPNFNGYAVATERSDSGVYIDNLKYVSLDSVYGETEYLYGDADNNGILTANDAAVVLQKTLDGDYITELENVCDDYLKYLDVDCSGILTANDAAIILQKTLSGDYLMPVETSTQQTTETTTESTTISTTISTTETTTETTTSANIKDYVVSGGAITFDTDTRSIIGYTGKPTYVVIPEEIDGVPVENIDDSVFESCSSLTSITLPGTIKKLGYRVFTSCRKLENVVIQNGTEEIDATSFRNCTSLKRIEIPDSVTTINVTVWYSDVTIVCHAGSYAESYANSKGLKTEIIE